MVEDVKQFPSDVEAERAVIGSLLVFPKNAQFVLDNVSPTHFFSMLNRDYLRAIQIAHEGGVPIDPVSISSILGVQLKRDSSSYGGVSALMDLTVGVPPASERTLQVWCDAIRKSYQVRTAVRLMTMASNDLVSGADDPIALLKEVEDRIVSLNNLTFGENEADEFKSLHDVTADMTSVIDRYLDGGMIGVKTGMPELDNLLSGGGLQPKAVYVLAAPEKTGKTALMLSWAYNIARMQDHGVIIVTKEMSDIQMTTRLLSAHTGIPVSAFRPNMYQETAEKAKRGMEELGQLPIHIADRVRTVAQMSRRCRHLIERGRKPGGVPIGAVFVDYLQLLEPENLKLSREQQVSHISIAIKSMASELDVPVVVISNMNRLGMADNERPTSINLRDSGQIAFDAEAVMFLWNPNFKPRQPYIRGDVEDITLIMDRQRNGPMNVDVNLKFIAKYMRWYTESQYARLTSSGAPNRNLLKEVEDQW